MPGIIIMAKHHPRPRPSVRVMRSKRSISSPIRWLSRPMGTGLSRGQFCGRISSSCSKISKGRTIQARSRVWRDRSDALSRITFHAWHDGDVAGNDARHGTVRLTADGCLLREMARNLPLWSVTDIRLLHRSLRGRWLQTYGIEVPQSSLLYLLLGVASSLMGSRRPNSKSAFFFCSSDIFW